MAEIRLALPKDKPAIETIIHQAYSPYIPRIVQPPGPMLSDYTRLIHDQHVYVVVVDVSANNNTETKKKDIIQGVLVLIPEPHNYALLLDNIAVAPSAQGTGLGRKMLAFAEQRAGDDKTCRVLRL
jgi:GNAT superfamily N-acetyltransferase